MDLETAREKLSLILQDIFDDPSLTAQDDLTAADVDGWDSLSHINLIVAVEKTFHIKFTSTEVRGLKNVGDFVNLIAAKAG